MVEQLATSSPCGPERPALEIRNAVVRFGGLTALDGVSLDVFPRQIKAIIGPNGAGKTTLFNAITGAVKLVAGQILLWGQDITTLPSYKVSRLGISRIFQITNVFPDMTVRDNVWLGFNARRRYAWNPFSSAEKLFNSEISRLCELVGLADKLEVSAGTLPHGDQRLLEIAIALSLDPQVVLLDEPTQGVSPDEVARIHSVIRNIGKEKTVLMIEHNMSTVLEIADVVAVMDRGRVLLQGRPHEIIEDKRVREAYLAVSEVIKH